MITIFLLACSITEGQTCKNVELVFEPGQASLHECMLYGQIELAKWHMEHPNWRVARWRCGVGGSTASL